MSKYIVFFVFARASARFGAQAKVARPGRSLDLGDERVPADDADVDASVEDIVDEGVVDEVEESVVEESVVEDGAVAGAGDVDGDAVEGVVERVCAEVGSAPSCALINTNRASGVFEHRVDVIVSREQMVSLDMSVNGACGAGIVRN